LIWNPFPHQRRRSWPRRSKSLSHIAGHLLWYPGLLTGLPTSVRTTIDQMYITLTIDIDVCGFFFRDQPQYSPTSNLEAFLLDGPPPIYIGFGSIVIDDPEALTAVLLEAVRASGVRAVISRGWSKIGGSSNTKDIFYLGDCPHGKTPNH
jgi:hypothetical protein